MNRDGPGSTREEKRNGDRMLGFGKIWQGIGPCWRWRGLLGGLIDLVEAYKGIGLEEGIEDEFGELLLILPKECLPNCTCALGEWSYCLSDLYCFRKNWVRF